MIFRSGTATITFSSRAAEFVQSLGLPSDRVFMTPYVVDNAFFAARAREVNVREVRRRWSIPVDAVIAAFVGKLVGWKRPSDLILAAAEVPDLWVIVAGEGQERPAMEALAIQVGVADRVRFLGFQNQTDLPAVYAAADVLVLPSEYEAFGLVVNEAFACGTPALVSESCGSASDLIVTGVTGFTFPPGDIARLAEELSLLSGDPSLRTKLAEGARRRISEWDLSAYREAAVKACVCAAAR